MTRIRIYCDWHKRPKVVGELRWLDQIGRWLPEARVTSARGWRAKAEWLEQLEEMLNHPEEHGYTREAIEAGIGELEEEFSQHGIDPRSVTGPPARAELWVAEDEETPVPYVKLERRVIVWESQFIYDLTCPSCKAKGKRVEYFKADRDLLDPVLDALRNQRVEEMEVHTLKRFYDKHANQVRRKHGL